MSLKDPPSAVGGLICFLFVGGGLEDFCLFILKAHGLRSMGLCAVGGVLKISLNPSAPNTSEGNTLDE